MFNNVLDRKETFFGHKKIPSLKVPKIAFSQRGKLMLLVKECNFFLYLFSLKITLQIMFNNVVDTKETFFGHKKIQSFKVPKIAFFQRG